MPTLSEPADLREDRAPGARGLLAVARRRHGPGVVEAVHEAHVLFVVDAPAEAGVEGPDGRAEVALSPDDLAFCPAGVRTRWDWRTAVATTYVLLDPDRVREATGDVALAPVHAFRDGLLREAVRAVAEVADADGAVEPGYAGAALRLMACHLARFWTDSGRAAGPAATALGSDDLAGVRDVVEGGLESDLSLGRLARTCHLSPDHFARRFYTATGETPHQYVTRLRVAEARRLLTRTRRPVADVALAVGYRSPSHFAQVFRRHVGVSPRTYRAASR